MNTVAATGLTDGGCGPSFPGSTIDAAGAYLVLNSLCQPDSESPQTVTTTVVDRTSLQPVTTLTNGAGGPMLSPDGTRIARRTAHVLDGATIFGPVEIDDAATGGDHRQPPGALFVREQ